MNIPKKIFYVWGANEKKRPDVLYCINSWKQHLPDYEIIEINEESKKYFNFKEELENNLWFKTVYEKKMYAYVADYVRIKTLYEHGGIYLDTDVSVLKSFDEFLNESAFVGIQDSSEDGYDNLTEPAILGSIKHNPFLLEVLNFYNKDTKNNIWNTNIFTLPQVFKFTLEKLYGKQNYPKKKNQIIIYNENITLYPESYFIPYRYNYCFTLRNIEENTCTIHWFGASWIKPSIMFFLKNKHKMPLEKLNNILSKWKYDFQPNTFIQNIFSIKNTTDKKYKIMTIFCIKITLKRHK